MDLEAMVQHSGAKSPVRYPPELLPAVKATTACSRGEVKPMTTFGVLA